MKKLSLVKQLELEIIRWNNTFPLDRAYRKKCNITYGSEEHRKVNQIDIFMQWLEDRVYDKAIERLEKEERDLLEYKKGNWLKEEREIISKEEEDDLFDNIKI